MPTMESKTAVSLQPATRNLQRSWILPSVTLAFSFLPLPLPASTANWPQFRGPHASGVSDAGAPIHWNVDTGENVRWQTPIPGLGHSCPIVWGGNLYITTAVNSAGKSKLKPGLYGNVES